jgi:hypothetical protein
MIQRRKWMKKLALLITFMIIFALSSFAQIDVAVSGSADMTIGINLNEPVASGILNATSSKISFAVVSGDSEKGSDADVHGYIKIGGWKAEANTDDNGDAIVVTPGSVEAKINFGANWLSITGAATSINYVKDLETDSEGVSTSAGSSGGMTLGIAAGPAAVEIGLFSENDWTQADAGTAAGDPVWGWVDDDSNEETVPVWASTTAAAVAATDDLNDEHAYGVSLKAVVPAGPATIELAAVMGIGYVNDPGIGVGAKIGLAAGPATVTITTDVNIGDTTGFEAGADVAMALADGLSAGLGLTYGDAIDLDMKVSITEDGAGGVVPGLGAGLTVKLNNLTNVIADSMAWAVEVTADYTTPTMKPYAKYTIDSAELMTLKVGAELYVIENVTFDLNYESSDLGNDNGKVLIITKISY